MSRKQHYITMEHNMSVFYMSFKFNIPESKGSKHRADNHFWNRSNQVQLKSNKINNEQINYKQHEIRWLTVLYIYIY